MLPIKEVSRVPRVQLHGLEALVLREGGAGPLPGAAHVTLARELVAAMGDRNGVPRSEGGVGVGQVDEQWGLFVGLCVCLA